MKETIDANLKDKAIENIKAPKKPDIVLFIWSCFWVIGNGLLTGFMYTLFGRILFMYAYAANVWTVMLEVGDRVFIIEVNGTIVIPLVVDVAPK